MKNLRIRLVAGICLSVLFSQTAHAQWVQTNGPYGGAIVALARKDSSVFAGTATGIYRSTDSGAGWTLLGNGIPTTVDVNAIAIMGDNIFAGTDGRGVFLSTDNGASWTEVNNGAGSGSYVNALAVKGSYVFRGVLFYGVLRSADSGKSWTQVNTGLTAPPGCDVYSFAVKDTVILAGTRTGMFRSLNNGANWGLVNSAWARSFVVRDSFIFAGFNGQGVSLSTNNGGSWRAVNNGLPMSPLIYGYSLAVSGSQVFVGTEKGLFRSPDTGANWNQIDSGFVNTIVYAVLPWNTMLFAGVGGGLYRSLDTGMTWSAVNNGITGSTVYALLSKGGNVFAGTVGGVFRSADNGAHWSEANAGLSSHRFVSSIAVMGNNLYIGTNRGVFLSIDDGTSWTATGLTDTNLTCLAVNGTVIFAGTNRNNSAGDIYRSTDSGKSWTVSSIPGRPCVEYLLADAGNLFAATHWNGVYLSADSGASWTPSDSGITDPTVYALEKSGTSLLAGGYVGIFISADNGAFWTRTQSEYTYALLAHNNDVFAGTNGFGVFLSSDNGTNWAAFNTGLIFSSVYSFTANAGAVFAGTVGGGVWRRPLSETGVINPKSKSDLQNPAGVFTLTVPARSSHTLAVSFALARPEQVTVKIFSLSGQEISTLVNKKLDSGPHRLLWDTRNLAAGCYAVRMQAGSSASVKSIPVLR